MAYPIAQGRLINVAAVQMNREKAGARHEGAFVTENVKEDLLKLYDGWEDEVKQLMQVNIGFNVLASSFDSYRCIVCDRSKPVDDSDDKPTPNMYERERCNTRRCSKYKSDHFFYYF